MTVILDIPKKYASVLSVTAIGQRPTGLDVTTAAVDLNRNNYVRFDENGFIQFTPEVKNK